HGRAMVEELAELFRTKVWPAYMEADASPDQLRQLIEKFKPVTVAALVTAYESAVNESQRETVARRSR
ncbi:MAG: MerR family transcriptional regulator, partial [Nocardioidaceae bacterium]